MYSGRELAHSSLHLAAAESSVGALQLDNKRQTLFEAQLVFRRPLHGSINNYPVLRATTLKCESAATWELTMTTPPSR